jgi:hypothetical protein
MIVGPVGNAGSYTAFFDWLLKSCGLRASHVQPGELETRDSGSPIKGVEASEPERTNTYDTLDEQAGSTQIATVAMSPDSVFADRTESHQLVVDQPAADFEVPHSGTEEAAATQTAGDAAHPGS